MEDQLKKYLLSDHSTRVQAVKLTEAWQTGLAHQSYPECVQRLLGELLAASILLASNIMFDGRSEEHTSELQSLMRISYAVFCLNKTTTTNNYMHNTQHEHITHYQHIHISLQTTY